MTVADVRDRGRCTSIRAARPLPKVAEKNSRQNSRSTGTAIPELALHHWVNPTEEWYGYVHRYSRRRDDKISGQVATLPFGGL